MAKSSPGKLRREARKAEKRAAKRREREERRAGGNRPPAPASAGRTIYTGCAPPLWGHTRGARGACPPERARHARPRPSRATSPASATVPSVRKMVVTARWMDGKTDIFDDVDSVHVANGVLTFREHKPWWSAGSAQSWSLPLANIRYYSADWVKRQ